MLILVTCIPLKDRSKARPSRKDDRAPKDGSAEEDQKPDHVEDEDKEKDGDGARDRVHKKEKKERVSLSFFDRLSTPKFSKKEPEHPPKETPPKKDGPIIRVRLYDLPFVCFIFLASFHHIIGVKCHFWCSHITFSVCISLLVFTCHFFWCFHAT